MICNETAETFWLQLNNIYVFAYKDIIIMLFYPPTDLDGIVLHTKYYAYIISLPGTIQLLFSDTHVKYIHTYIWCVNLASNCRQPTKQISSI